LRLLQVAFFNFLLAVWQPDNLADIIGYFFPQYSWCP